MSELTKRILFAVPAASLFVWLAWLGGVYFNAIMALLALGTMWEIDRLLKKAAFPGFFIISIVLASLLWFINLLSPTIVVVFAVIVVLPLVTFFSKKSKSFGEKWLSTLICAFYAPIGYLMAFMVRDLSFGIQGFWLILALFFMIWGNDVFAYFGGKSFGKHKFAPTISPNKTWEGFFFGGIGAVTGVLIVWGIAGDFPIPILQVLPAAFIVSITGPLGDLTESRFKRLAGMKDSSSLLPGHGGLFDRFDAMILSAPFIYFYFSIFV